MLSGSYGDIAQYTFLRLRNSDLKSQVQTLGQELTTGRTTNVTERLGGDFTYLAGIEHSIKQIESYEVAATEVTVLAVSMQASMNKVQLNVQEMRDDILKLTPALTAPVATGLAEDARLQLENSISSLNSTVGGRSLFAGTATKSAALNSADVLMTALVAEVSGLTTADDVQNAVDNWFDDPAGFDAVVYNGSSNTLSPIDVGASDEVTLDILATDDAFKQALRGFALGALTEEAGVVLTNDVKKELVTRAANVLATGNDMIINRQADVGFMEERVATARSRNAAENTSLSITKNKMLEADPYETYAKLEEARNQLESLYVVTQKSFNLSLLGFLR